MREEFKSYTFRDFAQRYAGTYGWFEKEDKSSVLVYVAQVTENSVEFMDAKGMSYVSKSDQGNFFTFIPLTKGSYQYNEGVIFIQRIPARQYKRGICEENCSILDLSDPGRRISLSYPIIEAIVTPKYFVYTNNISEINKVDFTVDGVFSFIHGRVYLYNHIIGNIIGNEIVVPKTSCFIQELEDMVRVNSLPLFVRMDV